MEKKLFEDNEKENILFLTDIPPCKNYTSGIMISKLVRFLLEEKKQVNFFCIKSKWVTPEIDEDIINNINITTYIRPDENLENTEMSKTKYYSIINKLKRKFIKYLKKGKIDRVVCIVQEETILELINALRISTKLKYIIQVWDPIEWWIKDNKFDKSRSQKVLKMYDTVLSEASCLITTSYEMKKEYCKKYNKKTVVVMPPLEMKKNLITNKIKNNEFIISMIGQVYAEEEVKILFDSLEEMNWKFNGNRIIFKFYGRWNSEKININKYNIIQDNIIINKFIPQNKLLEILSSSDLLYCPYFFSEDDTYKKVSRLSFPSKLVTYLSLNVPTLLHSPKYSGPYKFLENSNAVYNITSIEKEEIIKNLKQIILSSEKEKKNIVENANNIFLKNFSYEVVKKNFFEALSLKYTDEKKLKILEVNYTDLSGRRFNGFDLQQMINSNTIHSAKQIVKYKLSNDENVVVLYNTQNEMEKEDLLLKNEADILSVHSQLSIASDTLKESAAFINTDLIHYHSIHNSKLSLYSMIDLCKNKPSIYSVHDQWTFTGRCVCPQECEKWMNGCKDCKFLDSLFPFKEDNCASLWNLKKMIYENLDIDIVVATPYMMDMLKKCPLTKHFKNVHLIPFGLDLNKFKNNISKEEAKEKLGINKDNIVLFFRSMETKGVKYIIEALKKLRTDKKITLLTCGEIGLITELNNKYKIIELGQIQDEKMVISYNACDIFLMPSIGESFGMMAVEAMACSRPVVVFNNTALPSVTFAPDCGVLVKNKDSEDLMKNIKYLIEDEKERERRGKLGRKIAEENYDIMVYNNKMMELYIYAYNRQKNKLVKNVNNDKIDYESDEVKNLLKKLKVIYYNVFNEILDANFTKNKSIETDKQEKVIDYSSISIQNLLKNFNYHIYLKLKDEKSKNLNEIKSSNLIKQKLKNRIIRYPFLYKTIRYSYNIIKKLKKMLFNN